MGDFFFIVFVFSFFLLKADFMVDKLKDVFCFFFGPEGLFKNYYPQVL